MAKCKGHKKVSDIDQTNLLEGHRAKARLEPCHRQSIALSRYATF